MTRGALYSAQSVELESCMIVRNCRLLPRIDMLHSAFPSEESGELDDERAAAQQHQRQQAQLSLTAQLAELAARARAVAASREADAGSPAHHDARHRTNSQLAQVR